MTQAMSSRLRPGLRWALSFLTLVLLTLPSAARGGGGGGSGSGPADNPDSSTNASSPGDEVTSLPMVGEYSGLTFVGTARAIRSLNLDVTGSGRLAIVRLGGGNVAVTFTGDYRIQLDRDALARGDVAVLFRGGRAFQGGFARLEVGDSVLLLDPERVPLPLARLAASPRAQGELVTLDVVSLRHAGHVEAHFGTERVTLFQRLR